MLKINAWCSLLYNSLQDLSFFSAEAMIIESNCFDVLEICAFSAEVENFQQDRALHHYSDTVLSSCPHREDFGWGMEFQSIML